MSRPFLEERISVDMSYGTSYGEAYTVSNVRVAGGDSYSRLDSPYPILRYDFNYSNASQEFSITELLDLFHRSGGTHGGFRVRNHNEFTTNDYIDTPTFGDQQCLQIGATNTYQIIRWYGPQGNLTSTRRRIKKPVDGTVLVGIAGIQLASTGFSVDTTTGIITIPDRNDSITGITLGATTLIDFGAPHPFLLNDVVHFSGIVGTTELNNLRATVIAIDTNDITVNINSSAFTSYVSGGVVNTLPQSGEIVTSGCEFDIPMAFEDNLDNNTFDSYNAVSVPGALIEILNP